MGPERLEPAGFENCKNVKDFSFFANTILGVEY